MEKLEIKKEFNFTLLGIYLVFAIGAAICVALLIQDFQSFIKFLEGSKK